PRQSRALRPYQSQHRPRLRRSRRRLRLVRRHHPLRPRRRHLLPPGARMTPTPERRILRFPTVDSTQRLAAAEPVGTVVIADTQTAGQGRHGHSWHSEPGTGLYLSIVLEPTPLLTLALGVATVEAIAQSTGITCDLRWPNDLMLTNRKCARILVQLIDNRAVAGIGINLNHTSFPPELEATSLRLHSSRTYDREAILDALLPAIDSVTHEAPHTILRLFAHAS